MLRSAFLAYSVHLEFEVETIGASRSTLKPFSCSYEEGRNGRISRRRNGGTQAPSSRISMVEEVEHHFATVVLD